MYRRDVFTKFSPCWNRSEWDENSDSTDSMLDYSVRPREPASNGQEHAVDDWTNGSRSIPIQHHKFWPNMDFGFNKKSFTDSLTPQRDTEGSSLQMYNPVYGDRPTPRGNTGVRSPMRANHDLRLTFPDSDSGFSSSLRTRSGGCGRSSLTDDILNSPPKGRLMRSRSLSRLGDSFEQEPAPFSPRFQDSGYRRADLIDYDRIIKELRDKLVDSENRRTVLMSKLKEAQNTLQAQGDRLDRIENTAKENEYVVEDLKVKEQDYRQKIGTLEREQDERDFLRLENLRLREDMQTRISSLDHQLRSLQSQHSATESESNKRNSLLEQTSKALNLLEEENAKFQKERDGAVVEMKAAKDSYQVTKTKFALVEEQNTQMKTALKKITEEFQVLQKRLSDSTGKLQELESLVQTLRNENERLTSAWETTTQEKHKLAQKLEKVDEIVVEFKSQISASEREKEKFLQEKLEVQKQQQQLVVDKEHLMKSKISLEEQLNEQQAEVTQARINQNKSGEEKRRIEEELKAVKKVCEDLSSELSGVKSSFERALEQVSLLENGKRIASQQQQLLEQEARRLEQELQKAKDSLQSKEADFRMERSHLEETAQKYKDELRGLKVCKGQTEDKCRELETKLKRANEELQQSVSLQQTELESWKNTCERLTGSVSRKEAELQSLSDKCGDLEDLVSKLKRECKVYEDQLEQFLENEDISDRLREDNRRLLQEKAENEQMIQLLEMQKEVLTKSSESNLDRLHEVDQLMSRMDQLRNENTLLRDRIVELEKLRDNLMKQKDETILNSGSMFYNSDNSESKTQLKSLLDQNDQLQHVNQVLTKKMEKLEQENSALRLRANLSSDSVAREEHERVERDKNLVENELRLLERQHKDLTERHQRFVINYGHNNDSKSAPDVQNLMKEKAASEKQVAYLQGQMILLESSKNRAEEKARELREEVEQLEEQQSQENGQGALTRVADLEKSLKESVKKRESLETLVRNLKQQLMQERKRAPADDIDGDLSQLHRELEKLTEMLNGKDEKIEQLDSQLVSLKKELHKERQKKTNYSNGISSDQEPSSSANKPQVKPTSPSKSPGSKSPVLSQPMPLLTKSSSTPVKAEKSGGGLKKAERLSASKRLVKTAPSDLAGSDANTQQSPGQVLRPPGRHVHPRLKTLIERYKDNSDPDEEEQAEDSDTSRSPPTGNGWPYAKLASRVKPTSEQPSDNTNGQNNITEVRSEQPQTAKTEKLSSGDENGAGTTSSNGTSNKDGGKRPSLVDSQEQRDISALIQKRVAIPKPILSVRPPKITSKVVASLLSRGSLSPTSPARNTDMTVSL